MTEGLGGVSHIPISFGVILAAAAWIVVGLISIVAL